MQRNGKVVEVGNGDWNAERVFAGERLHCALQAEVALAINRAINQVDELSELLSTHEITGILAHGLLETAMRQIMMTKMPVSMREFEMAARLVYLSCHQHEGEEGHAH